MENSLMVEQEQKTEKQTPFLKKVNDIEKKINELEKKVNTIIRALKNRG